MSIAAAAIAEQGIGEVANPSSVKVPPPKRMLNPLPDQRQAPEPR